MKEKTYQEVTTLFGEKITKALSEANPHETISVSEYQAPSEKTGEKPNPFCPDVHSCDITVGSERIMVQIHEAIDENVFDDVELDNIPPSFADSCGTIPMCVIVANECADVNSNYDGLYHPIDCEFVGYYTSPDNFAESIDKIAKRIAEDFDWG